MTDRLRRIQPLPLPDVRARFLGERPALVWMKPTDLWVDGTYQRDLSRRSIALVIKMVREFAWDRMKPPIVVDADGKYHVIDGQHTAIAAATLCAPEIPVFVVQVSAVDQRARAFVGHNTDRVTVNPLDIYRALVASGDADALTVEQVCKRAGVRLRHITAHTAVAVGDCSAVGTVRQVVKTRGAMRSRQILEVLVKAKRAPVTAAEIKAVEYVICVSTPDIDQEALSRIIRIDGDAGLMAAQSHNKMTKLPVWKALIERWRRSLKDVRSVA